MEGETRTNVNYLEQLNKYHILTGRPVGKIPQLDKRPIDLYKLKNEVAIRGGVQEVTRLKKWAEIGRVLGYARKQCTSMSNALKTAYQKVILPYEIWFGKHKDDVDQFTTKEGTLFYFFILLLLLLLSLSFIHVLILFHSTAYLN